MSTGHSDLNFETKYGQNQNFTSNRALEYEILGRIAGVSWFYGEISCYEVWEKTWLRYTLEDKNWMEYGFSEDESSMNSVDKQVVEFWTSIVPMLLDEGSSFVDVVTEVPRTDRTEEDVSGTAMGSFKLVLVLSVYLSIFV